jgi:hypothetical protein
MASSAPAVAGIRSVTATRYVTPLRQGGSLPAIVEADDEGLYVLKFRAAAQGVRTLVAELIAGELGRALGLLVPEIVYIQLDPVLGRSEPDPEIQPLIVNSGGRNLGLDYLPGAINYHPVLAPPEPELASLVVWLDAFVANVDRSWRNTNLLVWHKNLWLIDHGAALYFHHSWMSAEKFASLPYDASDHVFSVAASGVPAVDAELAAAITPELLKEVIGLVPDEWIAEGDRDRYLGHLMARLDDRSAWLPGGDR